MRCEKIKERGAAAPAVQASDIVLQIYRFVQARGPKVANPAEDIRPSTIATFKPRDGMLSSSQVGRNNERLPGQSSLVDGAAQVLSEVDYFDRREP